MVPWPKRKWGFQLWQNTQEWARNNCRIFVIVVSSWSSIHPGMDGSVRTQSDSADGPPAYFRGWEHVRFLHCAANVSRLTSILASRAAFLLFGAGWARIHSHAFCRFTKNLNVSNQTGISWDVALIVELISDHRHGTWARRVLCCDSRALCLGWRTLLSPGRNEMSLVSALKTLLFFTILMVTLPIGLYFASKAYIFEGKSCDTRSPFMCFGLF